MNLDAPVAVRQDTMLGMAMRDSDTSLCLFLVQNGARLAQRGEHQPWLMPALHISLFERNFLRVRWLVECGFSPWQDFPEYGPAIRCPCGTQSFVALLECCEISEEQLRIQMLLEFAEPVEHVRHDSTNRISNIERELISSEPRLLPDYGRGE